MGDHFAMVLLLAGIVAVATVPLVDTSSWYCNEFDGRDNWDWCSSDYYSYSSDHSDRHNSEDGGVHVGVKPHKAVYLGCYDDARDRALPDAYQMSYSMTPTKCFDYCWLRNMRYAGLEASNQCYCGLDGTDFAIHGQRDEIACSSRCHGDYSLGCGGSWKLDIYDIKNASKHLENDIRLVNFEKTSYFSAEWYKGMVEIYHHGQWQAICDRNWSEKEAAVVCRQLGYGVPQAIYSDNDESFVYPESYSDESGAVQQKAKVPIAFSDITCNGTERLLGSCDTEEWLSESFCGNTENVGVRCKGPWSAPELEISHLEGGEDEYSGIVVYNYDGIQGFLCNNSWDKVDATVVCHELGFGKAITSSGTYTRTTDGIFLLGDIECSASDVKYRHLLADCFHSQWFNTGCMPGQEAAVKCHPPGLTDIRLADGPTKHEGRLELLQDGEWGTICDIEWDILDADVACRMLGYPWAVSTTPESYRYGYYMDELQAKKQKEAHWYGEGTGPIHYTRVQCQGYESTLNDCIDPDIPLFTSLWGCDHTNDVGIKCANKTDTKTFPVRLVDGNRPSEGRVEVKWNGVWGTVCDDNWDINDATVVCRQLGLGNAVKAIPGSTFGEADEDQLIIMDEVDCNSQEYQLSDCSHIGWNTHNCRHHEDAGVRCQAIPGVIPWRPGVKPGINDTGPNTGNRTPPPPPKRGMKVRLVDGSKDSEGRVEVSYKGMLGTVCSEGWDMNDANVVCLQLGYAGATEDGTYRDFGPGSGPVLLSNVDCIGRERRIDRCLHDNWGENSCSDRDTAAAAVCIDDTGDKISKMAVRLVDGKTKSEGHVEILRNGIWGAVCDIEWNKYDADVVCRQLGYPEGSVKATESSAFGGNNGPIFISKVYCGGYESTLTECSLTWDSSYCDGNDKAGVVCKTARDNGGSGLSAGMGSGITMGALLLLIFLVIVLVALVFFRRKKQSPDTVPIIPPSPMSSVSFSNMMGEQHQAIGGAIGGMVQPPPVYTPTEIKVPLNDSGVSAAVMAVPQSGAATVVPQGRGDTLFPHGAAAAVAPQSGAAAAVPQGEGDAVFPHGGVAVGAPQSAKMDPPNNNDNGYGIKLAASAPIDIEGATLDQVSL